MKYKYTIHVEYGSDYQKEFYESMLKVMLDSLKEDSARHHRHNKFKWTMDMLDDEGEPIYKKEDD